MNDIGILILDDSVESCQALHHLLDSEGWRVHFANNSRETLAALANGTWNLVVANYELAPPGSQLFNILRDLAHAEGVTVREDAEGSARQREKKTGAKAPQKKRLRVLFVVPANLDRDAVPNLEHDELPYSIRPHHLHDFFEKISDLLVEAGAIARVSSVSRFDSTGRERGKFGREKITSGSSMFASRSDYQMSEEEIVEYERQEDEQRRKKNKKEDESKIW